MSKSLLFKSDLRLENLMRKSNEPASVVLSFYRSLVEFWVRFRAKLIIFLLTFLFQLLGLCTGASVLTVVELFYFFFFRTFTKNLTTRKVYPISLNTSISQANQKSSVITFLMGFMENSSIHSFNFMKTEKHKIEK